MGVLEGPGVRVRIRLRLDPPELERVPWERLFLPLGGPWFRRAGLDEPPLFSRSIPARGLPRTRGVGHQLRALAVISSSANLRRYHRHPLKAVATRALRCAPGRLPAVTLTCLESGTDRPPTWRGLQAERLKGYALVHFLCHGAFSDTEEVKRVLALEDESSDADWIPVAELIERLRTPAGPQFCFFTTDSGQSGRADDGLIGLALSLLRQTGVQAVVALPDPLEREASRTFTAKFYPRLLAHGVIDLAVAEALESVGGAWEGAAPVLYSSRADKLLPGAPRRRP